MKRRQLVPAAFPASLFLVFALAGCGDRQVVERSVDAPSWPGAEWPVSTPEEEGVDAEAINALVSDIDDGLYGLVDHFLLIRGGKVVEQGARAVSTGGWFSMPQLAFNGGLLAGGCAAIHNVPALKGIHTAMKSGMLAAEAMMQAFEKQMNHFIDIKIRGKLLDRYRLLLLPDSIKTPWATSLPITIPEPRVASEGP